MKRACLSLILVLAAVLGLSAASGADKPLDVRDLMTANQYRSAGLDKLSPEQMNALNDDIANISVLAAAGRSADLENILTADQFRSAGLTQLGSDQMAVLNGWLTGYLRAQSKQADSPAASVPGASAAIAAATPATAPAVASGSAAFGASMLKSNTDEPDSIHSYIVGKFTGWTGNTLFKLGNGQVWQQSEPADYSTQAMNPEVVIKKMHFGYLLTLPGRGQTVFVIRLQ
jgi:hypothetical protein